jgi:hypothetical protein
MPGYVVDEHQLREFAIALREGHRRREREAQLLAQADRRKARRASNSR